MENLNPEHAIAIAKIVQSSVFHSKYSYSCKVSKKSALAFWTTSNFNEL